MKENDVNSKVKRLKEINNLSDDIVKEGQELKIEICP
ncbi:MAG: hypothetical protein DRI57_21350 [Deltaproteobacteria bacterium]|nr:MAG: hypothetical protein DRI57_21350 [Deltaproteobacteria bacterium]